MKSFLSNVEFCWIFKFFTTCLFGWIWHKGFTNVFIFVLYIFPAYLCIRFVCFKVSCCFDLSFISILTFYITQRRSEFSSWWFLLPFVSLLCTCWLLKKKLSITTSFLNMIFLYHNKYEPTKKKLTWPWNTILGWLVCKWFQIPFNIAYVFGSQLFLLYFANHMPVVVEVYLTLMESWANRFVFLL